MIPILYEKDETLFASNGLGRLRDMISCVVTEERNGIYECDFEYPITADDFNDIQLGRIIGVTHDDSDDIQPFDIVSYEKPIDGVVKFHCTHISYRQSYLTVSGKNINSLADAFARLKNYATPTNPFTYETDKTSTGYLASITGVPMSVRSILGGVEGSILDAYGGEYEWDKFRVILHNSRGTDRDFTIRYGVNMVDFNEELSTEGTYSACIPYWTDGTKVVRGSKVTWGDTVTGRGECVPLDVSDKFESKPTAAQVEAKALSLMKRQNTSIPVQNLHVEFIRLQDMPEYAGFGNLLKCGLCDTIKVVFPFSPSAATFKIVKTTWDVLGDRYESMELGDLSMSLSEALGVSENSNSIISPAWAESVDAKLQNINAVFAVSCAGNSSVDIDVPPLSKYVIFGIGTTTAKFAALVNSTSGGNVTNLKIAGGSSITLTNGTDKITVNNGYAGTMSILVIDFRVS